MYRTTTKILIGAFFVVAILLPLGRMLLNLGSVDLGAVLSNEGTQVAIKHSVIVSTVATILSLAISWVAAWCMNRTNIKFKSFLELLLILPMLIPSMSHGMGLIILLGSNGRITKLLGLSQGVYGFWGIVIGSIMYAFPVGYLMISDILKYEDSTPYEAAKVLGIPKWNQFTAITAPYLRKPLINVIFALFTMIITDYGVPIMIGGMYKTLPVLMYEEVIGRQDFGKGTVFGVILLIPAVIAFLIDTLGKEDHVSEMVKKPFTMATNPLRDGLAYLYLAIVSVCVVYPIVSFMELTFSTNYPLDKTFTFKHAISAFSKGAGDSLVNSLIIALAVASFGVVLAFICAYYTKREQGRGSRFIHLMSIISVAIPGIVLGLSYVLFFKGTWIYGTIAILIMVNTIHFFASPYLMIYNSLGKMNPNLEAVGKSLGVHPIRLVWDVFVPQTISTLAEMFSYFFVNSMMTISAVSFLYAVKTKPISMMIPQFEAMMLLELAAFVSLIILVVNLTMKGIIAVLKKVSSRRRMEYATEEAI